MKRQLRVLLVEDARDLKDRFIGQFRAAFASADADIEIEHLDNYDKVDEALAKRPHVAIFDNVLVEPSGVEKNNIGIAEVSRVKAQHADTVFTLYSENTFEISQLGVRLPNPDFLVSKMYLQNADYQTYVGRMLTRAVKRFPFGELSFQNPKDKIPLQSMMTQLRSVVEQCLFGFWDESLDDQPLEVRLKPLTGGYSGSHVFQLEFFGVNRYENIPFVLKFSKRTNVVAEMARYNSYVRLQLPHEMRVDLIGYGEAGEWAGACYAFAFGRASGVITASEGLRTKPTETVKTVLARIFDSTLTRWYLPTAKSKVSLSEFFANREEYEPRKDTKRLEGFKEALQLVASEEKEHCTLTSEVYRYGSHETLSVRRSLARLPETALAICHGHGDLNANNIFIDADAGRIALIDFEYSGLDFCFKDFISFESSVRVEMAEVGSSSLAELIDYETALLEGKPLPAGAPRYLAEVAQIRNSAAKRFTELGLGYSAGLALHSLKLLGLPIWSPVQKKRLCAAVFAAAGILQLSAAPAR